MLYLSKNTTKVSLLLNVKNEYITKTNDISKSMFQRHTDQVFVGIN